MLSSGASHCGTKVRMGMLLSSADVVDFYSRTNGRHRKGEQNDDGRIICRLTFTSKVTKLIDDRANDLVDGVSKITISANVGA